MKRPSIALCIIAKDEESNLPRLLESVEGCFDEIHVTDTGSSDRTVDVAKAFGCKVHHFKWIDDFSAARNYSFSHAKTQYIMWLDCDDVLSNKQAFIEWRNNAMETADYWLANYHYALDPQGKPSCSFIRERVIKNNPAYKWEYFVHEGIIPLAGVSQVNFVSCWEVLHLRSGDDLEKDRSRNLKLFKDKIKTLNGRMKYYYGKELFECQRPAEAEEWFWKALEHKELEQHDRLLSIQYLAYALDQLHELKKKMGHTSQTELDKAISVCMQGIALEPHRAEYHCFIGDSWLKKGNLVNAIPFYEASKNCINKGVGNNGMTAPIFTFKDAYSVYPREQLARIYAQLGRMDESLKQAEEALAMGSGQAQVLITEIKRIQSLDYRQTNPVDCQDIVITGHPHGPYEWDGEIYREKGIGGSETAAVEMAEWLHKKTNRKVIVFNNRTTAKTVNGVEYIPTTHLNEYFKHNKPKVHIAWRHNIKVTDAPTYVWAHDIFVPHGENTALYEKMLCLSDFAKQYNMSMFKIPSDKIVVTRNGINPDKWDGLDVNKKISGKIVFPSSPDRGLKQTMQILDLVRSECSDVRLHVFYGFDNLLKGGRTALVDELKKMLKDRESWVTYHGNVEQKELVKHMCEAEAWVYPADWYETFCITALECLKSKAYPIVRPVGALKDYMKPFADQGMVTLIEKDLDDPEFIAESVRATISALKEQKWKNIKFNTSEWTWESLADEWINLMGI